MRFPDADAIRAVVDPVSPPAFAEVRYEPPAPEVDDPGAAARRAVGELPLDGVPDGGTVAVGLGSRGVRDVVPVATAAVDELRSRGYDPVAVPAMGSHGGATAEGQTRTLASLGLTADRLGCPVDARMETRRIGETAHGGAVHLATAALDADGVLVINRVKPHTNFHGAVESGLCKMTAIGLGKREGASAVHDEAVARGYVEAITGAFEVMRREAPVLGGVAIVENFYDRAAQIRGVPATDLPDAETELLDDAREYMATLPFDELDALVVDEMGKDISGTGMDTNVIGRYRVLNGAEPDTPEIKRIFVRGLTEATHGNGHGVGLADVTTVDVAESLDLEQMYANALTSGSLARDALPVALPSDELALAAVLRSAGPYDPETARVAWVENTLDLSTFYASSALAEEDHDHLAVERRVELGFEDGEARFRPAE